MQPHDAQPAFARTVVGVHADHGQEAVDQAISLAAPGGKLAFVCVHGDGDAAVAERALQRAAEAAAAAGADASTLIRGAANPAEVLLEEAAGADLLSIASHREAGLRGVLGSTASVAVHDCAVPVLVARRPPDGAGFPGRILVATDGSADAHRAIELTGRIARAHGSQVDVLSVDPAPHGEVSRIAVDIVTITEELGAQPTVLREAGHAHDRILEVAKGERISLGVVGSRGQTGLRTLGSVSERVAHRAPCSVLVARA